jgi:molecular chaperone GrpE
MEETDKSIQKEHGEEKKPKKKRAEKAKEAGKVSEEESEIKRLRSELEAKTLEARENLDKFLRKSADIENLRKRIEKEKEAHTRFANEELIRALLPVIDDLERAMGHTEEQDQSNKALESLCGGIRLTLDKLHSELKKFGLEAIKAEGERFDPTIHEAMSHEESREVESGTVISEFRKGYLLKKRLLRPALVVVSKKPEEAEEEKE